MKKIMEHYAATVIAAIVALVIIGCFYHVPLGSSKGIPAAVGTILTETLERKELQVKTGNSFDTYASHEVPTIYVKNANLLYVGEKVLVSELLGAKDGNDRALTVEILGSWKENGEQISLLSGDKCSLYPTEAGRYWLQAGTTDGEGFCKQILVQIFVNER